MDEPAPEKRVRKRLATRSRPAPRLARVRALRVDDSIGGALGAELRAVVGALRHRWRLIALSTVSGGLLGFVLLMLSDPVYNARAQILIDPRIRQTIEGAVVQPGLGQSAVGADTLLVDSQIEIIQSRTLVGAAVDAAGLLDDVEFHVPRGGGLRLRLRNALMSVVPGYEAEVAPILELRDIVIDRIMERHVGARRIGNTYVVDVDAISADPATAVRLANAVAEAYVADVKHSIVTATEETTVSLSSRIDALRDRVRLAEDEVERFRAENGLLGADGVLVDDQQLRELNASLGAARTRTTAANARLEQLRGIDARKLDVGATNEALNSPTISSLRTAFAAIAAREAIITRQLGARHPDAIAIKARRRSAERLIGEELQRIEASATNEAALAGENERTIDRQLDDLKTRSVTNNKAEVKLRELQREANAARAVFETFLNRTKETREIANIPADGTRILTVARMPQKPIFPQTTLIAAGAVLGGLLAGLGLAWLLHLLRPATAPGIDARRQT